MLPPATEFWTPANLAALTGGRWEDSHPSPLAPHPSPLTIDTRTLKPGQLFLAIKGDRFDGHDYLEQAITAGALAVIAAEPACPGLKSAIRHPKSATLLVPDTLKALHALAAAWRDVLAEHGCKVIAVAGSNGKTTTRHLIHHVLSNFKSEIANRKSQIANRKWQGTQSPKSFNNHIGVPLTLLAASPDDHFVVAEVGTNHPGEIATLAKIVRPDIAVITSIGEEHLEYFGDLEGVAREEFSLLNFVNPAGLAVIPDARRMVDSGWRIDSDTIHHPPSAIRHFSTDPAVPDDFPLPGAHNRSNAAAAAAVARWLGMDDTAIREALCQAAPVEGRMQIIEMGDLTLLHDAYNANPSSMRAALETLMRCESFSGCRAAAHEKGRCASPAKRENVRRVAILGDMLELGDRAPELHHDIGEFIASKGPESRGSGLAPKPQTPNSKPCSSIDLVITLGPLAANITAALRTHGWPEDRAVAFPQWSDDLPQRITALLNPGDVVLLKASRAMKLERLIDAMENR